MRRRFSAKAVLALGMVGFGALSLPSCATNDSMMFIIGVYARQQGTCSPKPDASSPTWARGVMDRLLVADYTAALLIGNQLTERGSREQVRTETARVALRGAEVRLETPEGDQIREFSTIATGFVDAAGGTDPSLAIMYADLIPSSVTPTLALGVVVANVRVFGDTLGGQEVESNELLFPIEICEGCLVAYPASERDLTAEGTEYRCKTASDQADSSAGTALPCQIGVDLPVPCSACSGVAELCQSPANNPYYTTQ
jgi:hypothetical protein